MTRKNFALTVTAMVVAGVVSQLIIDRIRSNEG